MLYEGAEQIYLIPRTLVQPFETVDIVEEASRQLPICGKGETLVTFQCFALTVGLNFTSRELKKRNDLLFYYFDLVLRVKNYFINFRLKKFEFLS